MTTTFPAATATQATSLPPWGSIADGVALTLTGLFAGFFLTYTMSVVRGLGVTDDVTYVTAFQGINETVRNLEFGIVFFGTLPAILWALAANRDGSPWPQNFRITAAVLIVATIVITFVGNVPLNRDLEVVNSTDLIAAADARASFESLWNQLNLARTCTAVLALIALVASRR